MEGFKIKCSIHDSTLPSVDQLQNELVTSECGALSSFVGVTRADFQGRKVTHLFYECYESMALKEMNKICAALCEKHGLKGMAMAHRTGEVPISEASVVIVTASAHRKAAIEACAEGIDLLKESVPIWKKEFYEDEGEAKWKENPEFRNLLSKSQK